MKKIINAAIAVVILSGVAGAVEVGDTAGALSQLTAPELSVAMPKVEEQKAEVGIPPITGIVNEYKPWDNVYYRSEEKAAAVLEAWKAKIRAAGLIITWAGVTKVKRGYSFKIKIAEPGEIDIYVYQVSDNSQEPARQVYDRVLAAMKSKGMEVLASGADNATDSKPYASLWFNYVKKTNAPAVYDFYPKRDNVDKVVSLMENAGITVITVLDRRVSYIADKNMVAGVCNRFFTKTAAEIGMAKNVALLKLRGLTVLEAAITSDSPITNWQYAIFYLQK